MSDADLVLTFSTSGHDQGEVLRGVRSVFGDASLSGCSVEGIITREGSCEDTHAVGLMAFRSPHLDFHTFLVRGYGDDSQGCAQAILDELPASKLERGGLLLIFPAGAGGCTSLLESLNTLPPSVTILGGVAGSILTSDPMDMEPSCHYQNEEIATRSVSGVLISGDFDVETSVSHGCVPIGLELEVTRSRGTIVEEINHRPAWDVFKEHALDADHGFQAQDIVYLSVGVKLPDAQGTEYYGEYAIRSPAMVNYKTGSVRFQGRIDEGSKIFMVRRDLDRIHESALSCARELRERRDEEPIFLLHFDCAGRGRLLFGERTTELVIEPIHQAFSRALPLIGFHSFGEIAPLGDSSAHLHSYTVALCAVYHRNT